MDLSGNVFSCLCHDDDIGTIQWIHEMLEIFINHHTYMCRGHEGVEFIIEKDMDALGDICSWSKRLRKAVFWIIVACLIAFGSIILLYVSHKNQHRLQTLFYRLKLRFLSCVGYSVRLDNKKLYDVYVGHCADDNDFVRCEFLQKLENEYGLQCCVPDRDFPGTGVIFDHIDNYIASSSVVVFILSKSSINDALFSFAMKMSRAHERLFLNGTRILYVTREDPSTIRTSNGVVQSILDSRSCIKWPAETSKLTSKIFEGISQVQKIQFDAYPDDTSVPLSEL